MGNKEMDGIGKRYWRSLNELSDTPEFRDWLHREFPAGASELTASHSRRTLLKLMAASFGLAGLVACRRPEEKILPQAKGVEDFIPGKPMHYATAMTLGGFATGLVVEAHDGRPTKIEGNPKHPSSLGAATALAQASVLGLYDPDRSQRVLAKGQTATWEAFERFARDHFAGSGEGVWILSEAVSSPSLLAVRDHFLSRMPGAQWVEYEPASRMNEVLGAEIAFGRRLQPRYHLDRAELVLALDCDLLGVDAPSLAAVKQFARGRQVETERDRMNRLYAVESGFSITGAMADHRFRMKSSAIGPWLRAMASGEPSEGWDAEVLRDLEAHRGRCLVMAGPRQPAAVHALAYLMNEALDNLGAAITFGEPVVTPSESRSATWPPRWRRAK